MIRHCASLRFSDTLGLAPCHLTAKARGYSGALTRTKTSGADRKMAVLPIFLSDDAFVHKLLLRPGLALWTQGPLAIERDYFLPWPTVDFLDTCRKRARYSDSRHLSRSLLSALKTETGEDLLLPEAVSFWTERSDRSGVDGWLATLGVDQSLRSFVGRLSKQGAADRVTENLQKLAAAHAKDSFSGGADHFGEEHMLDQLRAHFLSQDVAQPAIEAQVQRLTVADFNKHPAPLSRMSSATSRIERSTRAKTTRS